MKQQLWIINSSFIVFFVISLLITNLLEIPTPKLRISKRAIPETEKKKEGVRAQSNWEKIYKDDIFGTYVPKIKKPVKKSYITPVPEPTTPDIAPPPELPKQEFIEPLKIAVKGIIVANDEARNVAMIEDETQKEGLYHLGEKIKDAQLIKITKNRVVALRGNGQQEVFYLRKEDVEAESNDADKWKYIIKKIEENIFEIDPTNFKKEVLSLGNLLERSSIIGTAYHKGKPIGIRVGSLEKNNAGDMLGFKQNDIITSIENIETGNMKNRIKIYDYIKALNIGDSFNISLQRQNKPIKLSYKLASISKAKKKLFTGEKSENKKKDTLKKSRIQKRETLVRDFKKRHPRTSQHKEAIARIRQRLLENLRTRLKNSRVR